MINKVDKGDLSFGYIMIFFLACLVILSKVPYANLLIKVDYIAIISIMSLGLFFRIFTGIKLWIILSVVILMILVSSISRSVFSYTSFIYSIYLIIVSFLKVEYMLLLFIPLVVVSLVLVFFGGILFEVIGVFIYITLVVAVMKYSYAEMIQSEK